MAIDKQLRVADVLEFLGNYPADVNELPYDVNGLFQIILGAVDNLIKNGSQLEVQDYAWVMDDRQAALLTQILEARLKPIED